MFTSELVKAGLILEQFGKGRPHHRATALDLLAECINHERQMKVLDRGPPQETEFHCYLGFLFCFMHQSIPSLTIPPWATPGIRTF